MSFLSDNLRYLRSMQNCSQLQVANELVISRGRYAKYEEGMSEPPLNIMQRISNYFKISIDVLISIDVRDLPKDFSMFNPVFSREGNKQYVTGLIGEQAEMIVEMLQKGGVVIICGSVQMQKVKH